MGKIDAFVFLLIDIVLIIIHMLYNEGHEVLCPHELNSLIKIILHLIVGFAYEGTAGCHSLPP